MRFGRTQTPDSPALSDQIGPKLICRVAIYGSILYAAKLTSFSPVYFFQAISCFAALILLSVKGRVLVYIEYWPLIFLLLIATFGNVRKIMTPEYVNLLTGIGSYLVCRSFLPYFRDAELIILIRGFIKFSALILLLDSVYRLINPSAPTAEHEAMISGTASAFYLFKFSSVMFADSNTTGLIALLLIALLYNIRLTANKLIFPGRFWMWLLTIIVFLSLSRAAILSLFLCWFLVFLLSQSVRFKFVLFLFLSVSGVGGILGFSEIIRVIGIDGSLDSKIYIINGVVEFLKSASAWDLLFGRSFSEYNDVLGMSTHLFFLSTVVSLGFLGLVAYLFFFALIFAKVHIILIPFFMVGLSYFLYAGAPFLFVPLAIGMEFSRRRFA